MATLGERFGLTQQDFAGTPEPAPAPTLERFTREDRPAPAPAPTLGQEFRSGFEMGADSLQMSLFGVASMAGRELEIPALRDFGDEGVQRNAAEMQATPRPTIGSISEIEDAGDFFKWAAAGLGQALPSLATTVGTGGIGGVVARKTLENSLRRTATNRIVRQMEKKGFSRDQAAAAAQRAMESEAGKRMLIDGVTRGTANRELMARAVSGGATRGAVLAGAVPQIGQIDMELQEAGVSGGASALTAFLGGSLGGALEALPALRLIDKMFPGVDQALSKGFVKDLAQGLGVQSVLEGSTEGAQEFIQLAALAFHDPSFDPFSEESRMRVLDAFAIGALVGGVTGGGAEFVGAAPRAAQDLAAAARRRMPEIEIQDIPEFDAGAGIADPDFQPADNTVFQEVQARMRRTVQEQINPAMNTVRRKATEAVSGVRSALGNGVTPELRRVADTLRETHEAFVVNNQGLVDQVTQFSNDTVRRVATQAEAITDPVRRQEFISSQIARAQEEISRIASVLRNRAQQQEQAAEQNVAGMAFDPDENIFDATPTRFVFGRDKTGGRFGENDLFNPPQGEVQGFRTRKAARKLLGEMRTRFPSATDNTFAITQQEDGTFVVELNDPANAELLIEDDRIARGIESARMSARRNPDKSRQFAVTNPDGTKTMLDMPTLIYAARDLEDVNSYQEGLATILGRLREREMLTNEQVQQLAARFGRDERRPLPRLTPAQRELDALPEELKRPIQERLDDELPGVPPEERRARRDAIIEEEIARLDEDRFSDIEEMGTEARFMEEGAGRQFESDADQARRSARDRAPGRRTGPLPPRDQAPKPQNMFSGQAKGKVYMPGVSTNVQAAAKKLVDFLTGTLGVTREIRVINHRAMDAMSTRGHPDAADLFRARRAIGEGSFVLDFGDVSYIVVSDQSSDPNVIARTLAHEIGHVLHWQEWGNLTPEAQKKLRAAFVAATRGRQRSRVVTREAYKPDQREFQEWMADQLAAWMVTDRQATNAVEQFFKGVADKLKQLFNWMRKQPDYQLDETFAQFIEEVTARVRNSEPSENSFFRNEAAPRGFTLPPKSAAGEPAAPNPVVLPAQLKQALAKFEKDYPRIAQRAVLLRNWIVNAYSLAAAPGNSIMMQIGKRVPAANELVRIFGREEHGKAKRTQNYHQRVTLAKGNFMSRYVDATRNWSDERKAKMAAELRAADNNPNATLSADAKLIRAIFDDAHRYLRDAGLPVGKVTNYFPRQFSRQKLIDNQDAIIKHLSKNMPTEQARGFFNALISNEAEAAAALAELGVDPLATQAPGFQAMRSRTAQDPFFDQFLEDNLDAIVSNYVNQATKRAEFNRLLGEDSDTKNGWRPRAKLDALLKNATEQGATEQDLKLMKQFVDANLGMLGRDFDKALPGARPIMASIMAYQNMRVLLFTVFASLPDMVGPAIRSGDLRGTYDSVMKNLREIASNKSDLHELARAYGVVSDAASEHIMTEYVDNHYMPPTLRKWNDAFFKYTGLESYTNFTRKMALAVGKDYIARQAALVTQGPTEKSRFKAKAALAELGLTKDDVWAWVSDGSPTWTAGQEGNAHEKIAEALVQFVDESIMRPNAAQRPILSSHPAAMLVFHLKTYMYAMYEVILRRMAHNFKVAETPAQVLAAGIPAIMILGLTALGLELRELVQYAFSDREPRSDRMDGWEYTWDLVQRSGLTGPAQLAFDFESADRNGMTGFAAIGGPALGQFAEILSRPPSQTVPKAIPVAGQIPWMRDGLRELTPL